MTIPPSRNIITNEDDDRKLDVYTEGDTDSTIDGLAVMGEGSGNTVYPLQLDSNKNLLVASGITAGTAYIYNITMTNANTEYSQALPTGTKRFTLQCRGTYDIRYAFETGKVATPTAPYMTLKAGMVYYEDDLNLTSRTIYLACGTAGQVVEIICWT